LTQPLLTATEITCTGVDYKNLEASSQKGLQNIATANGRCEITWIEELNLFHISIYELNSREYRLHTKRTKISKFLLLDT